MSAIRERDLKIHFVEIIHKLQEKRLKIIEASELFDEIKDIMRSVSSDMRRRESALGSRRETSRKAGGQAQGG